MAFILPFCFFMLSQIKFHNSAMFPIDELFGSEREEVQFHLCSAFHQPFGRKCCDCSDDCMKYKTCCINKLWDNNKEEQLQPYLERFLIESKKYKDISCEPALKVNRSHAVQTYYMVKSCLPNVTGGDVKRCLQPSSHIKNDIPVLGNDTYLYRNLHCAKCNLVFDYKFIDIQAKCENASVLSYQKNITRQVLSELNNCEFSLDTGNSFQRKHIRECKRKEISYSENNQYCSLCNAYGETMGKYKNYHCALCKRNQSPKDVFFVNRTVLRFILVQNSTHTSFILKNVTIRELHTRSAITPFVDYTCQSDRCRNQHCYLPKGKDSTKFEYTFSFGISSKNTLQIKQFKQKFPIWQFMNISKEYDFRFDEGLEQYLCNAPREKCCDCSDNCMEEKKCCIDKFWNETHPVSLRSYISQFIQKSQKYKDLSCEPVLPMASSSGYQTEHQLMVKSCLPNANTNDVRRCLYNSEDTLVNSNVPVNGSDGYIYRNSFCAKCNFISQYKRVSVSARCNTRDYRNFLELLRNNSTELDMNIIFKECLFSLPRSNYKLTECNPEQRLSTNCQKTSKHFQLCHAYKGGVGGFRNYHCWYCNQNNHNFTIPPVNYCDSERCPFGVSSCYLKEPTRIFRAWSLLIDYNSNRFRFRGKKNRPLCNNGRKYDITTLKCEKITCGHYYVSNGHNCVSNVKMQSIFSRHLSQKSATPKFNECFFYNITLTVYIVFKKSVNVSVAKLFQPYLPSTYHTTPIFINRTEVDEPVLVIQNVNQNISDFAKFANSLHSFNLWQDVKRFVIAKGNKLQYTKRYNLDMSRYFPNNHICAEANVHNGDDRSLTRSCMVKKGNKTFSMDNISMWITIDQTSTKKWYSTCRKFHLISNCTQRKIIGNISFNKDGDLLHIRSGQIEAYKENEYIPLTDSYGVCIRSSSAAYNINNNKLGTFYLIEYYISLIGTCVSIIAYILMMLIFFIFKELRTVPGLNTLGMCVSLLIADTTFLLAMHSDFSGNWCKIIAVVLHWCLLNAFMWNLIIAYDLISKFSSFTVASGGNSRKKFIRRCICSLIVPTFIVSLSLTLEETSTLDIGYGVDGICWITKLYARVGFYIIPVTVIFVSTISTLLYAAHMIHREFEVNEVILKTGKKTKKETLIIALKLGIILGVIEGLGFIQIAKANLSFNEKLFNACFALLYSTFRSLRGIMLFLVYVMGGNVIVLYRNIACSFTAASTNESGDLTSRLKLQNTSL